MEFLIKTLLPSIRITPLRWKIKRWRCPKCRKRMVNRAYGQVCFSCDMYATDDLEAFLYHWNGGPASEAHKEANPRD